MVVQDLSVSDKTAFGKKVTLWNDLVDTCKKGVSYKFTNMRLCVDKLYGNPFLATTKDEGTVIEETESMGGTLEGTINFIKTEETELRGEFVGVESIFRYKVCVLCGKNVGDISLEASKSISCQHCNKRVKIKACPQSFVVKATFQQTSTSKLIKITLFKDQLLTLLKLSEKDLTGMVSTSVEEGIMDVDEIDIKLIKDNVVSQITHLEE